MEKIKDKIMKFYSLIEDYKEGAPDTRYKSWEWCHQFFLNNRLNPNEQNKDIMALHLAFYLASWGMYRGSSYLLQRDYKAHKKAVDIILDPKYENLWNYVPTDNSIEEAAGMIFGNTEDKGVYWRIKESYKNYEGNEDDASDTLVTKILMGTFGCIPAFDRYLKSGISAQFDRKKGKNQVNGHKITQSIDNIKSGNGKSTFIALSHFVKDNSGDFIIKDHQEYPPMKCLDMYLWEIGYELDLVDTLSNNDANSVKFEKAKERVIKLGLASENDDKDTMIDKIRKLNEF